MIDEWGKKDEAYPPLDASAGLYHEAQADGVPYAEDSAPFDEEPSRS